MFIIEHVSINVNKQLSVYCIFLIWKCMSTRRFKSNTCTSIISTNYCRAVIARQTSRYTVITITAKKSSGNGRDSIVCSYKGTTSAEILKTCHRHSNGLVLLGSIVNPAILELGCLVLTRSYLTKYMLLV